jgi:UDP-N-acetylglucosamine 2-epimerase (non-hydrolysing)
MPIRTIVVFGTRPEAIKMAPVCLELKRRPQIETIVCVTAQHRQMLDEALSVFGIVPDFDLDIMRPGQDLAQITASVLAGLTPIIRDLRPDRVLVHGDTTTSFAAALASFYLNTPVGHVEAGLRTGNLAAPWPEELNRRIVDTFADLLWAPTEAAAEALRRERACESGIIVTGNTVIDALRLAVKRLDSNRDVAKQVEQRIPRLTRRRILVTGHRRESFDGGHAEVCKALARLALRSDVEIVWPVHPNPLVVETVRRELPSCGNVHLISPLDYLAFIALMRTAHIIITDSGGIQEEAPSLGKPVLVTRNETERPEAVAAGTARLVGTNSERLFSAVSELLDDERAYSAMVERPNPFGDGFASRRIADSLLARSAPERMSAS